MEKILCAAIWVNDDIDYGERSQRSVLSGYVIGGFSHDQIRRALRILGNKHPTMDGFLTNFDRFVSRTEATTIAYLAGQIKEQGGALISDFLHQ